MSHIQSNESFTRQMPLIVALVTGVVACRDTTTVDATADEDGSSTSGSSTGPDDHDADPATSTGTVEQDTTGTGDDASPEAVSDEAVTTRTVAVIVDVLANDRGGDDLEVRSFTEGEHGTVHLRADGSLVYTPSPGFDGTDHFSYSITDARGGTSEASVDVTVLAVEGTVAGGVLFAARQTLPADSPAGLSWWRISNNGSRTGRRSGENIVGSPEGEITVIPVPEGATSLFLHGVADDGTLTGFTFDENWDATSFIWRDGEILDTWTEFLAQDLNEAGFVTGYLWDDIRHSFYREPDGTIVAIEAPADVYEVCAISMGHDMSIVGQLRREEGGILECFIRSPQGQFTVLEAPEGFSLGSQECRGIDVEGRVAGFYRRFGDQRNSALVWSEETGFAAVHFPFAPAPGARNRSELLTGVNDGGDMVGYTYETVTYVDDEGVLRNRLLFRGIDLSRVEVAPNTRFDDTPYDYVAKTMD